MVQQQIEEEEEEEEVELINSSNFHHSIPLSVVHFHRTACIVG
jgi:hypothetical protein